MATSIKYPRFVPVQRPGTLNTAFSTVRYWIFWTLFLAALAIGINAYFDFRNRELDKRLEQITISYSAQTNS
jgi:hypothetical protein